MRNREEDSNRIIKTLQNLVTVLGALALVQIALAEAFLGTEIAVPERRATIEVPTDSLWREWERLKQDPGLLSTYLKLCADMQTPDWR